MVNYRVITLKKHSLLFSLAELNQPSLWSVTYSSRDPRWQGPLSAPLTPKGGVLRRPCFLTVQIETLTISRGNTKIVN